MCEKGSGTEEWNDVPTTRKYRVEWKKNDAHTNTLILQKMYN